MASLRVHLFNSFKLGTFTTKRQFSISQSNKAIPPLLWVLVKPLTKLSAILFGRSFRKWWQKLPEVKRTLFLNHLKRNTTRYTALIGGGSLVSTTFYISHVEEHPLTKRKRFILFSNEQLAEIEASGLKNLIKDKKILSLESVHTQRCLRVANSLFKANKEMTGVRDIKWSLTVVDEENIRNAAAFPSGRIIVYTGLLNFCKTDHELAVILAHEMSHSILMHSAENVSHKRLIDYLSILFAALIWTFLPNDAAAALTELLTERFFNLCFLLPYSRFIETEADEFGIQLAARACFDIRQSVALWKRMSKSDREPIDEKNSEQTIEIAEYLSTHPANETRSNYLEQLMPKVYEYYDHY